MKRILLMVTIVTMAFTATQALAQTVDDESDVELQELVDSSQVDALDAFSDTTAFEGDSAVSVLEDSDAGTASVEVDDFPTWFKSLFVGSTLLFVIFMFMVLLLPVVLPVLLLLLLWLIVRRNKKKRDAFAKEHNQSDDTVINDNMPTNKKLYRSDDRMIGGVCAGLAEYLEIDTTLVRVAYALLTLFTAFSGLFVYIILLILMPTKQKFL